MAAMTRPSQLIMVPGHAVYLGCGGTRDPGSWGSVLRGRISEAELEKEIRYYNEHIEAGVREARLHAGLLLVFAGGKTIPEARFRSEGESYGIVAEHNNWYSGNGSSDVRERSYPETFSRDSFENLLGSMIVFRQVAGEYPHEVIVAGFGFKEERFRFHAETLGVRAQDFHYIAVNNPEGIAGDMSTQLGRNLAGERTTSVLFRECPLCDSGTLLEKKLGRDIFHRGFPYPEAMELLRKQISRG